MNSNRIWYAGFFLKQLRTGFFIGHLSRRFCDICRWEVPVQQPSGCVHRVLRLDCQHAHLHPPNVPNVLRYPAGNLPDRVLTVRRRGSSSSSSKAGTVHLNSNISHNTSRRNSIISIDVKFMRWTSACRRVCICILYPKTCIPPCFPFLCLNLPPFLAKLSHHHYRTTLRSVVLAHKAKATSFPLSSEQNCKKCAHKECKEQ